MKCEQYLQYEYMKNVIGTKVHYGDKIGYVDRLPNGQFYDGERLTVNVDGVYYLAKLDEIRKYYEKD